jgi:hypothetical protein
MAMSGATGTSPLAPRLADTLDPQRAHLVLVDNPSHHPGGDFRLGRRTSSGMRQATSEHTLTYAGIGIFRPDFFAAVRSVRAMKLRPLLDHGIARGLIRGERHSGRWVDVGTPERLAELDRELARPHEPSPLLRRRQQLLARLGDGVAVIPTAPERVRNRDAHYPYRFDSYFWYLSGFPEPDAVIVLVGGKQAKSILFCREKNEEREIWDGFRYGPETARRGLRLFRSVSDRQSRTECCPNCSPTAARSGTRSATTPTGTAESPTR